MKTQPRLLQAPADMENMHHIVGGPLPAAAAWYNATAGAVHRRSILSHVAAFYWGKEAEFLFPGWPGSSTAMYALALVFVFVLALLVEWLSHIVIKAGANRVASGFFQAGIHAVRAGFAYMVILAVTSYNGGVFLAAVLGHAVGFVLFGSRVLKRELAR